MAKVTLRISDNLVEEVDGELTYGDSRSEWARDSFRLKLDILDVLDNYGINMDDEERREFVVEAVRDAIDEDQ